MTELRDDELLPQTPQEVIDALGFDPRDLDEAQESAIGIMPGNVPNLTGWPRQRSMLGESNWVARGLSGDRRPTCGPAAAGRRSEAAAHPVGLGARPLGAAGRQVGGADHPGPLSRDGDHVRDSASPQTLGRVQETVAAAEWAVVLEGDADWDPDEHPRETSGTGRFADKGSGQTDTGAKEAAGSDAGKPPSASSPVSREQWFGTTLQFAKRLKDDWPQKLRPILEEYAGRKYDDETLGRMMDVLGPGWRVDSTLQVANKINVVREIGARIDRRTDISPQAVREFAAELESRGLAQSRRPTKITAEYAADIVLGIWSSSSSDGNPASQALQAAVAEVIGVEGFYDPIGNATETVSVDVLDSLRKSIAHDKQDLEEYLRMNMLSADGEAQMRAQIAANEAHLADWEQQRSRENPTELSRERDEILAKHGPVLRAIVQEIYQNTQEQLKAMGVEELVLFRGMALDADDPLLANGELVESDTAFYSEQYRYRVAREVPLRMQPISSFSASLRTAGSFTFGERGQHHALVAVTVPREKIFATCVTGIGCLAEAEVVVLHHDQMRGSVVMVEPDEMNSDKARRLGDPSTVWGLLNRASQERPESHGVAESEADTWEFVLDLDADQRNADWIDRRKEVPGVAPENARDYGGIRFEQRDEEPMIL